MLLLFAGFSPGGCTPKPQPSPPFRAGLDPSSLPSWQPQVTGCEDSSDIRGRPAPAFLGAASRPPPTPGPQTPRVRRLAPHWAPRDSCSDPSPSSYQTVLELSLYLAVFIALLRDPPWKTTPLTTLSFFNPTAFKLRYLLYLRRHSANICWLRELGAGTDDLRRVKAA